LNGAKKVYAIDSGTNQLAQKLVEDRRVVSIEGTNARYLTCNSLPQKVDFVVMDVSFISQTLLYNAIINISNSNAHIITLFKPQFEVGKSNIGKKGIVKSDKARKNALDSVLLYAKECGFEFLGFCESPIKGGDGNIEYLLHFMRK
jgi:23S rRNA (cytidine1920-2'-O)/16S rRNA (cytidine1409-2'-O)-methyltransferase